MIKVLTIIKNLMDELNISYTFDEWDNDIVISEQPQFIGEITEVPTSDEDGKNEYSFILTGYGANYGQLFFVSNELKNRFKTSSIIDGVVIKYDNTITISNDTDGVKQIQINLKIMEWSV
jgi:hypothetical protein